MINTSGIQGKNERKMQFERKVSENLDAEFPAVNLMG